MSKERPFKSFKTPSERPFKTYNPSNTTSMLFQDPQQEQPLRLGLINGLMQQQQHQQQQHQHQPQHQHMPFSPHQQGNASQQIYGDPDDYLQLNPQQRGQNPMMNIDPSLSSYYEDLGLDDPDNPLIRPDLLVTSDSILQREQDLNIGQAASALNITPNFIIPNRHNNHRGTPGMSTTTMGGTPQDSLSMLFDQSQLPLHSFPTSLQLQQQQQVLTKPGSDRNCIDNSTSNGSHFLVSMAGGTQAMMGNNNNNGQNSNGRSSAVDSLPSSSAVNVDHFPIKREADEGHSLLDETPSPSSTQSPTQSDSIGESPKRHLKRSVSNGSGCSNSNLDGSQHDGKLSDGNGNGSDKDSNRDPAYLEKRRKNNESAKRSREARRNKEELVAIRVITLEEENMKLRAEISLLDKELDELRSRLFT